MKVEFAARFEEDVHHRHFVHLAQFGGRTSRLKLSSDSCDWGTVDLAGGRPDCAALHCARLEMTKFLLKLLCTALL